MTFRLRHALLIGFCTLALSATACNDDNKTGSEQETETRDGDGDGDPGDGDGAPGDGDGAPGDGDGEPGDGDGEPGDGDGEPGDGDGEPGDGDGEPGDGDGEPNPGICAPAPGDDACDTCVKDECCNRLEACAADAGCLCVLLCVEGGTNQVQCHMDCDLQDPNITFGMLIGCTQAMCADACM